MVKSKPYRIGITGSYGGLNLGDEAILTSMLSSIRCSVAAELTVFSRNGDDTLRRHQVEHAFSVRDMTREEVRAEIETLDLLVFGGGGILYDREAEVYLREVFIAHELRVPVMVYAISVGPLRNRAVRELVHRALDPAAVISVRDRQARRLLEDIGIHRKIHVTADPALLLEPEPLPAETALREGLDPPRRLVAFSVREPGPAAPEIDVDHYHRLLANAADFMVDRFEAEVMFVPLECLHMDIQHSHAVVAQMQCAQHAAVLRGDYTPGQMLSLIGRFDFAVGMRLHFLIFAALQGVPFVPLPYASKVNGLAQELGMDMPPIGNVTSGRLLATIDHSWDLREQIRARIRTQLPDLQRRARMTHELLVELLHSIR